MATALPEHHFVEERALKFLHAACLGPARVDRKGTELSVATIAKVSNPELEAKWRAAAKRLIVPTAASVFRWVVCPASSVDAIVHSGFAVSNSGYAGAELCGSGLVVFNEEPGLGSDGAPASALRRDGSAWSFLYAEVVLGRVKRMTDDDVQLLSAFPAQKCDVSLREDGYDTVQIFRESPVATGPEAHLLFNAYLACPRYVVFLREVATPSSMRSSMNSSTIIPRLIPLPVSRGNSPAANTALPVPTAAVRPSTLITAVAPAAAAQKVPQAASSTGPLLVYHHEPPGLQSALMCSRHPQKSVEFWDAKSKTLLCSHCLYYGAYN